jgi:hypothetical protein
MALNRAGPSQEFSEKFRLIPKVCKTFMTLVAAFSGGSGMFAIERTSWRFLTGGIDFSAILTPAQRLVTANCIGG